jgi:hypothetical protein
MSYIPSVILMTTTTTTIIIRCHTVNPEGASHVDVPVAVL